MATMSILGLLTSDETLFDTFMIPDTLNKDLLLADIVERAAELEILYSDPEYLKFSIGNWSNRRLPTWNKLLATLSLEYDPIYNYDRYEEYTFKNWEHFATWQKAQPRNIYINSKVKDGKTYITCDFLDKKQDAIDYESQLGSKL